ncbi:MAG: hypothetical protein QOG71_2138 [Pyrinomonadaceae bacterium]|nr:hypothetical protein [Pyrinomonadaceae bacterium]
MSTTVYGDDTSAAQPSARLAATCACLLMLVALVDSQVVAAITPQIAAGLGSAKTSVAASVMVYALAAAAVALVLGRRAGRVNPVRWLPAAAGIFVAANALAAFAPHVALFWTARALAGLAGGLVSALVIAALADASSYARRGRQMSGVAVAYFLAPVLGVPVGAWLAGRYGWRVVFAASAVLVAVAGLLVRQFPLPRSNETTGGDATDDARAFDDRRTQVDDRRATVEEAATGRTLSPATVGASSTTGRKTLETGRASLWQLAMRSRSTRRGITSAFFISGGLVGLTTYLGTWLSDAFRAGAREVGLIYALAGAGAVAGGALGGVLADRYGKRRVAIVSSALMIFLVLVLPTFSWGARLWAIICATAFLAALRVAPLQALVTELVAASERATYVALRNGASQLGIALAVAAGARLYPRYGLAGVGAMCAALTLGATLSMRKLADPHDAAKQARAGDDPATVVDEQDERTTDVVDEKGASTTVAVDDKDVSTRRRRFSGRGIARKLAAVIVALVLLVTIGFPWLLSFAITKAGTRPDERRRTDTPADHGATFETVSFASTDGNTLSGWYLPARGDARQRRVTFVLTHGLFRSRYEMLERGLALWREGYGVLLYDLRRHGASAAEFSTIGYDERHDVAAAFAFVRAREPQNRVVLMGVSMGAAATLLAASEISDGQLLGVVAESSFLSFADTVRHHVRLIGLPTFPFATLLIKFTSWRLNFAADDYDLLRAVGRISRPVLFIGGTRDVRMPTATVLEPLYAAAQSAGKRKFIVEGATHGHAYDESPESYVKAVNEFVESIE